jgi:DNA-binding transcriptional MocR family regulator
MEWSSLFASRASRMQASEIRELLKLLVQPDIISFAGGIPDARHFPVEAIAEASQSILSDPARAATALQYSVSEGYRPLREWIAGYMGQRGLACTPDNILITNGSQQALDFLGKLFISPGDTILTANPTYLGALQAFNAYEPVYDTLPGRSHDRAPESYLQIDGPASRIRPKFGYVMAEFQNPTGTSLTLAERETLLDFADALGMPLIEDNAYECLRYDGDAVPSLVSLAAKRVGGIDQANVIYCGTFSKSIVPALRIGWIVAPVQVVDKLVLINQASDLHVSPFNQMIMHDVAARLIDAHAAKMRGVYKARRDAMLKALADHMPGDTAWTTPAGGMFVWVTLPDAIDAAEMLKDAIEVARIAFVPGEAFHPDRSGRNTLRLSFSLNEPAVIDEGIARLAGLVERRIEEAVLASVSGLERLSA